MDSANSLENRWREWFATTHADAAARSPSENGRSISRSKAASSAAGSSGAACAPRPHASSRSAASPSAASSTGQPQARASYVFVGMLSRSLELTSGT